MRHERWHCVITHSFKSKLGFHTDPTNRHHATNSLAQFCPPISLTKHFSSVNYHRLRVVLKSTMVINMTLPIVKVFPTSSTAEDCFSNSTIQLTLRFQYEAPSTVFTTWSPHCLIYFDIHMLRIMGRRQPMNLTNPFTWGYRKIHTVACSPLTLNSSVGTSKERISSS